MEIRSVFVLSGLAIAGPALLGSEPGINTPGRVYIRGPKSLAVGESGLFEISVGVNSRYLSKARSRRAPFELKISTTSGLQIENCSNSWFFNCDNSSGVCLTVRATRINQAALPVFNAEIFYHPIIGSAKILGWSSITLDQDRGVNEKSE